jgi:hypothetical protein
MDGSSLKIDSTIGKPAFASAAGLKLKQIHARLLMAVEASSAHGGLSDPQSLGMATEMRPSTCNSTSVNLQF